MPFTARLAAALTMLALAAPALHATNWPQWRGPAFNGTSPDTGIPTTWDTKTNVAWSLVMPDYSSATPIVWGDTVFLNVASGNALALWAVDRNTGTVRWKQGLGGGNLPSQQDSWGIS